MVSSEAKKVVRLFKQSLLQHHSPIKKMFLFGSFAQGKQSKWSDIDVAVIIPSMQSSLLWKEQKKIAHISLSVDPRIEPHVLTIENLNDPANILAHEIKKTKVEI